MKTIITEIKKIFLYSIKSIVLTSLLAGLFSLLKGNNLLKIIFNANYIVSSIIIGIGLLSFFIPIKLKKSKGLVDHSNIAEVLKEEKEIKLSEAMINLSWGICNIIVVGVLEIVVKSVI